MTHAAIVGHKARIKPMVCAARGKVIYAPKVNFSSIFLVANWLSQ
ncbi:MAG: hypothetical protein ABI656_11405 [bacterium]